MSRTGILSDKSIMEHCQIYQPIPMRAAQSIIPIKDPQTQFGSKKLKYPVMPRRPQNFDIMAKSLTRMYGDSAIRDTLEKQYPKQVQSALTAPQLNMTPQRATFINPQSGNRATFTPMITPSPSLRASPVPTPPTRPRPTLPYPVPFPDPSLPTGFPAPPYVPLTPGTPVPDDLDRRATELFEEMPAPYQPEATAMSFPRRSVDGTFTLLPPPGTPETPETPPPEANLRPPRIGIQELIDRRIRMNEEQPGTPETPPPEAPPTRPPRIGIQELIDRRARMNEEPPKSDDEDDDTPQFEDVRPQGRRPRMNADQLAQREALIDSDVAARALQTSGRTVLRNRAVVSAAAAEQERSARAAAAAQSAFGRRSERIDNQSVMSVPTAIQQLEAYLSGLQDPPGMG